ncbi:hypothetical protein MTO96_041644 [Rhipicephalus appendiculatus]
MRSRSPMVETVFREDVLSYTMVYRPEGPRRFRAAVKVIGLAKGVSVPTVAEARWATFLARQAVTPANDQEEHEARVHGEDKPEKAEHGEKLN